MGRASVENIIGNGRGKQLTGEENTGNAAVRFGFYLFQLLLMKLDLSVLSRNLLSKHKLLYKIIKIINM